MRCSAAESPGGRLQPGAAGAPIRPASDQSQSADERQEAVDEEVEQVDEDVGSKTKKASAAERGGRLAGREDQQQRPVADHVGLRQQADPGDHHHVGEAEREPELLLGVRGAGEVAEPFAEVGDHVEDAVRARR